MHLYASARCNPFLVNDLVFDNDSLELQGQTSNTCPGFDRKFLGKPHSGGAVRSGTLGRMQVQFSHTATYQAAKHQSDNSGSAESQ